MAEAYDHLEEVKSMIGVTGDYQDTQVKLYIEEVKGHMASAGVPQSVINSKKATGTIARGVDDLWIRGGDLSMYFIMRCAQLSLEEENTPETQNSNDLEKIKKLTKLNLDIYKEINKIKEG